MKRDWDEALLRAGMIVLGMAALAFIGALIWAWMG